MRKGDIVLVPFPFTDLSGSKNRPALILAVGEMDITVAFVSTQLQWKEETDVLIPPTLENGLKKESLLRLSKLATIDNNLVMGKLGELESKILVQINKNLKKILQLDD